VVVAGEAVVPLPVFAPELVLVPELFFAPGLAFVPELVFAPELVGAAEAVGALGAAPLLATGAADALPLVAGAAVPDVASLLGAAATAPPAGADAYVCPATAAVAGCVVVALSRCAKSYAIAPPSASVAMTFSVMNTIATRSLMGHLPLGLVAA
jgi:hypothetical protein